MHCAHCGGPLPADTGRGRHRRYCTATCRKAASRMTYRRRAALADALLVALNGKDHI